MQQTNRHNYYHLVSIMHIGSAGAPCEARSSATDFCRSRLELAKGNGREILIIRPIKERNEQAWTVTSHSEVKAENKCELGLKVMTLVTEITEDSVRHPGSVTQHRSEISVPTCGINIYFVVVVFTFHQLFQTRIFMYYLIMKCPTPWLRSIWCARGSLLMVDKEHKLIVP